MAANDEATVAGVKSAHSIRESATVVPVRQDTRGGSAEADARAAAGFASPAEFARDLVDIGLIGQAELDTFAENAAEGVLGLSRALIKAGKLTAYQAAAVYQKKSRGLLIGNYLTLDKLGQGGMGVVFKARHRLLGRVGALKMLPPSFARDKSAVMRFRREVEAAGRLKHPNVVAAIDADEDRGVHFLVMDYVAGHDLDKVVRERGRMPVLQAIDCLIQAARGLEAAHGQGIIHRDIKPGNLMLDDAGTVRVLDLGLARIVEAGNPFSKTAAGRLTESGMYMGTIDFMAPEQAEDSHRVDHKADIYSLGCTLFYLLTGREPFPGETVLKRLMAHMERPAPSLRLVRPDVPHALDEAYEKMMAKRPADRPASMTELLSLLETARNAPVPAHAAGAAAVKGKPELKVFDEANLKRAGAPRTKADPSIFARPNPADGLSLGSEISLEDLVMDVRPEARPAPLPTAPSRRTGEPATLKRFAAPSRRRRAPRSLVIFSLAAPVILLAAVAGFLSLRKGAPRVSRAEAAPADPTALFPTPPLPPETSLMPGTVTARAEPRRDAAPASAPAAATVIGTSEILARLEKPIPLHFPNDTRFVDILKYIKFATKKGPNDPGIPIYVDPIELMNANRTMSSLVKIDVDGVPLKVALEQLVGQLGLAFLVKDDVLIISSSKILDGLAKQRVVLAADASPATKATLAKLDEPIVLSFALSTPLSDVLRFIKSATKKGPNEPDIAIYVNPVGLQKVNKGFMAPVAIELEGVPLKTSLRLLLSQLDLAFVVKDGALQINSSDAIQGLLATAPPAKASTASILVGTSAILAKLEKPISLHFPNETPFVDVLKFIKSATKQAPHDPGIPIYVDPIELMRVKRTLSSTVKIDVDGVPLKVTLKQLVGQLGLAFAVKDDVLIITSSRALDAQARQRVVLATDASPATKAVLAKLEQPIDMPFGSATPLADVLRFIKSATEQGPNDPGIPIFVDPAGLQRAERTMVSVVTIELEGVPLKTSLRLLLAQLNLAFVVKDGSLAISSSDLTRRPQTKRIRN